MRSDDMNIAQKILAFQLKAQLLEESWNPAYDAALAYYLEQRRYIEPSVKHLNWIVSRYFFLVQHYELEDFVHAMPFSKSTSRERWLLRQSFVENCMILFEVEIDRREGLFIDRK